MLGNDREILTEKVRGIRARALALISQFDTDQTRTRQHYVGRDALCGTTIQIDEEGD